MLRLENIRNHIIDQVHAQRAIEKRNGGIKDIDASYKSAYKNILYIGRKRIKNEWSNFNYALENLMRRECARTIMGSAPTAALNTNKDGVISKAKWRDAGYRDAGFEMLEKVYFSRKKFTTIRVAEAQAAASFVPSAYTVDDIPKFAEERIAFMDETIAECQHPDNTCDEIMMKERLMKERQRFKELVAQTF